LRAIELARRVDDPNVEVAASYATARTLAAMGEREEAQRISEAMLIPAERLRNQLSLIDALWMNGTLRNAEGSWQDTRALLERIIVLRPTQSRAHADLAVMDCQVGDMDQGKSHVERLLENPPAGFA